MGVAAKSLVFLMIILVGGFSFPQQSSSKQGIRAVDTLKFLVLVTRHGNRCPLYSLPNDPYTCSNTTLWPYEQNLSVYGRKQLYLLGQKLRSLYDGFLDSQFFNKDVYVSSTTSQRVVESAKCLMAGLYPATGNQIWNDSLLWNPVPIHQDSLDKTVAKTGCSKFQTMYDEQETLFAKNWADNITYFNSIVSEALDGTVSGSVGVLTTWDSFVSDSVEGYELADWTKEIFPAPMAPMMNDMYVKYVAANDDMTRFTIGPFFAEMMDVINGKVNGTLDPDRTFYYWSGHDDTLIALQAVLGLTTDQIFGAITPGSAMLYELHQDPDTLKYFLQILYFEEEVVSIEPTLMNLSICNNETTCDYDLFVENTAKFTNVTEANYNSACSSS